MLGIKFCTVLEDMKAPWCKIPGVGLATHYVNLLLYVDRPVNHIIIVGLSKLEERKLRKSGIATMEPGQSGSMNLSIYKMTEPEAGCFSHLSLNNYLTFYCFFRISNNHETKFHKKKKYW